jgi:hypothetical protein
VNTRLGQTFDRDDGRVGDGGDGGLTGPNGGAINVDGTSPADGLGATDPGSGEAEEVPQHEEERHGGIGHVDEAIHPVHMKLYDRHRLLPDIAYIYVRLTIGVHSCTHIVNHS